MTIINRALFETLADKVIDQFVLDREEIDQVATIDTPEGFPVIQVSFNYNPSTKLRRTAVTFNGQVILTTQDRMDQKLRRQSDERQCVLTELEAGFFEIISSNIDWKENLGNMFYGHTSVWNIVHPIGMEVNIHNEDDSRRMLITYKGKSLYALEEAIGIDFGIGVDVLTPHFRLKEIVTRVLKHIVGSSEYEFEFNV
ncbi:hypothetical protein D5W64_13360 [Salmonella enterica subsp. enterica serovar Saintpaul]|nr:hypothetical protein [Salmonella enterica subsp. enterica serovar Saintpaul]